MRWNSIQWMAAGLATVGLALPPSAAMASEGTARAKTVSAPKPVVRDVALSVAGELRGQLLTPAGVSAAGQTVSLVQGERVVSRAETNDAGEFGFRSVKPGVYALGADGRFQACRVWSKDAAPPSATTDVVLVNGDEVVRGQCLSDEVAMGLMILVGAAGVGLGTAALIKANDNSKEIDRLKSK